MRAAAQYVLRSADRHIDHHLAWDVYLVPNCPDTRPIVARFQRLEILNCFANMGSYSEETNLLEYLRSKSQVDCDCLDTDRRLSTSFLIPVPGCANRFPADHPMRNIVAKNLGKFVGSTSNQVSSASLVYLQIPTTLLAGQDIKLIARKTHLGRCLPRAHRASQSGDTQEFRGACAGVAVRI